MKILILRTGVGNFGKIGTYNVQEVGLAKALQKMGHEVNVAYLNRPTKRVIRDETYDFVYYLPHRKIGVHGIFDVNLLGRFAPDRVIMFADNQLWAKNVISWCQKHSVSCVQYFGAVLSNTQRWLNRFYTKMILRRNMPFFVKSINISKTNAVRREMEALGIRCDGVVNIGLDVSLLHKGRNPDSAAREELDLPKDATVLLYVGRTTPNKRPFAACDMIKAFMETGRKCLLVMIGKGPLDEQVDTYIKEHGLTDAVKRIPSVPYGEMFKYYLACDCCINPCHVEIFGMTILESMYYGIPLVAHTAPGPNEIIKHGETGYLCDTDDVQVWVATILDAIANRDAIAAKARREVENRFSWDAVARGFLLNA